MTIKEGNFYIHYAFYFPPVWHNLHWFGFNFSSNLIQEGSVRYSCMEMTLQTSNDCLLNKKKGHELSFSCLALNLHSSFTLPVSWDPGCPLTASLFPHSLSGSGINNPSPTKFRCPPVFYFASCQSKRTLILLHHADGLCDSLMNVHLVVFQWEAWINSKSCASFIWAVLLRSTCHKMIWRTLSLHMKKKTKMALKMQ